MLIWRQLGWNAGRAITIGVSKKKCWLVARGFLLFTLLDGLAGEAQVAGLVGKISTWWIELAILPFGLPSIPILIWCYRRWPEDGDGVPASLPVNPEEGGGKQDLAEEADDRIAR